MPLRHSQPSRACKPPRDKKRAAATLISPPPPLFVLSGYEMPCSDWARKKIAIEIAVHSVTAVCACLLRVERQQQRLQQQQRDDGAGEV